MWSGKEGEKGLGVLDEEMRSWRGRVLDDKGGGGRWKGLLDEQASQVIFLAVDRVEFYLYTTSGKSWNLNVLRLVSSKPFLGCCVLKIGNITPDCR